MSLLALGVMTLIVLFVLTICVIIFISSVSSFIRDVFKLGLGLSIKLNGMYYAYIIGGSFVLCLVTGVALKLVTPFSIIVK